VSRVDILCGLFQRTDMVTYEQAADALGLHPVDSRKAIRDAMLGAGKRLLNKDGRALRAVPDVGYRLAEPNEHVTLARERKRRGRTQMEKGLVVISGTDLTSLSQEAREAVLAERNSFSRIVDFIVASDRRQRKTEAAVEEIKGTVDRTAEETAKLRADLDRLQKGSGEPE
jgi:antitoxin (DNA-binding transcriptional repressor) of toxin-antitoxin stability system